MLDGKSQLTAVTRNLTDLDITMQTTSNTRFEYRVESKKTILNIAEVDGEPYIIKERYAHAYEYVYRYVFAYTSKSIVNYDDVDNELQNIKCKSATLEFDYQMKLEKK